MTPTHGGVNNVNSPSLNKQAHSNGGGGVYGLGEHTKGPGMRNQNSASLTSGKNGSNLVGPSTQYSTGQ